MLSTSHCWWLHRRPHDPTKNVVNKATPYSLGNGSVAQPQILAAVIRYVKVA